MRFIPKPQLSLVEIVMLAGALLLLTTIGAHAAAFRHQHPLSMGGEKMQAVMHGEERRWFVLMTVFALSSFALAAIVSLMSSKARSFAADRMGQFYLRSSILRQHVYLVQQFKTGLLHSRVA